MRKKEINSSSTVSMPVRYPLHWLMASMQDAGHVQQEKDDSDSEEDELDECMSAFGESHILTSATY